MNHKHNYDVEDQLDIFGFMEESEQDKQLYEENPLDAADTTSCVDPMNALCKVCANCQYKAITNHTKMLSCTMFDCDMHRAFTECRGYKPIGGSADND